MRTTHIAQRANKYVKNVLKFHSVSLHSTAVGMLILSDADVHKALSMKEAIDVNREAFKNASTGKAVVPPRIQLPVSQYEGVTLFKPAHVLNDLGLKVVSTRPKNSATNMPTVPGYIFLVDEGKSP